MDKTVLQSVKTLLETANGLWTKELPKLMWAYRTTLQAPTGETPFLLTFRFEVVAPTKHDLPSFRTGNFQATENDEVLRQGLDLVEKK